MTSATPATNSPPPQTATNFPPTPAAIETNMRNMSFFLTTPQMRDRAKTVTRRLGWQNFQRRDLVRAVVKCQGLKAGQKIEPIGVIRILNVRREELAAMTSDYAYGVRECAAEGFPGMLPENFVKKFCASHKGCTPSTVITRIKFEHVDSGVVPANALAWEVTRDGHRWLIGGPAKPGELWAGCWEVHGFSDGGDAETWGEVVTTVEGVHVRYWPNGCLRHLILPSVARAKADRDERDSPLYAMALRLAADFAEKPFRASGLGGEGNDRNNRNRCPRDPRKLPRLR